MPPPIHAVPDSAALESDSCHKVPGVLFGRNDTDDIPGLEYERAVGDLDLTASLHSADQHVRAGPLVDLGERAAVQDGAVGDPHTLMISTLPLAKVSI